MALNLQQRCKSGALIDTEVRCNALDVDGRDVLAYVTHDVSLRRKAEQQLIDNQQRLDRDGAPRSIDRACRTGTT